MRFFYNAVTFLTLSLLYIPVFSENNLPYQAMRGINGQTYLVATLPNSSRMYLDVYFRTGPLYEYDSLSGLNKAIAYIITNRLQNLFQKNSQSARVNYVVYPDQVRFSIEGESAQFDQLLSLVREKIFAAKFNEESTDEAVLAITQELDSFKQNEAAVAAEEWKKKLWKQDYVHQSAFGNGYSYRKLSAHDINSYYNKYYLPLNSCITVASNLPVATVLPKLEAQFRDYVSNQFNPEQIVKVMQFKPVVNYIQLLNTKTANEQPLAKIIFQNPGTRQDRNAVYSAFVLAQLINDPAGEFQKRLAGTPYNNLRAEYECGNFYGSFTISVVSMNNNFNDQFTFLQSLVQTFTANNYTKDGAIEIAARNLGHLLNDKKKNNPRWLMEQVARYRFTADEHFVTSLNDSLNNVRGDAMKRYIQDYFVNRDGIRLLETPASYMRNTLPEQQYYPIDEHINDLEFTYALNKTDLEGESNNTKLQQLIQWLRANPDNHVQVNGFADKGEFKKTTDSYVMKFLDSIPTFRKAMPDKIKPGYLRIEMMRAIKIIKLLYEAGISDSRLTGTSMTLSSENNEQAAANRKCTVTIQKIKPRSSLYEYHYGKAKEEDLR